jgi:hypothetical protein
VERVAEFAVTQVAFNPAGTYLACSSVANSISLISLDENLEKTGWIKQMVMGNKYYILAVIIILLAIRLMTK